MTLTRSTGLPVGGGPIIPTVMNCRLADGDAYRHRQGDRFVLGQFGFVPVTMVRAGDQIFPDLGRGPMRTVVRAGQARQGQGYVIKVEHDPAVEPGDAKDETRHEPTERIFARRPACDTACSGLECIELELPADMDCDGNPIEVQRGMPAYRIAALAAAVWSTLRPPRGSSVPTPCGAAAEQIGLGSRRGDVDWLGRHREFTADADMGVWEQRTIPAQREPLAQPEGSRSV